MKPGHLAASLAICLLAALGLSSSAAAALPPYELDPQLSLTGDCSTSPVDPIPDPSCPYPSPPAGPTQSNCTGSGSSEVCSSRFEEPRAVAIDSYGNEYVASYAESDDSVTGVDVFDSEGKFITELATPPAKSIALDSQGNLYLFRDIGQVIRYAPESPYEPEAGSIKYEDPPVAIATGSASSVGALAVDSSNDHLVLAQGNVVTIFGSAAESNGVIDVVGNVGEWVESIALDSVRGRIYVTFCADSTVENCAVKVLSDADPYPVLEEIDGSTTPAGSFASFFATMGLAVDEDSGDLFVADSNNAKTIYQFNEDYEYLSQLKRNEFQANVALQIAVSNGERSPSAEPCEYPTPAPAPGEACNRGYLFVPVFQSSGRVGAFQAPDQTQPVIESVATGSIEETEAELVATIDPRGLKTTYRFELTTQAAFEAEGFEGAAVFGGGSIPAENLATEVRALATGLLPGGEYRFRAVAENELGPAPEEGQNEASFTTYDDVPPPMGCPNQALRTGFSVQLPDCRAYELVTPPNTLGRSPKGVGFVGNLFPTVESSPAGDTLSFKVEGGSLPGSSGIGSFEGDPYVANRGSSGWSSELAGPTGDETTAADLGSTSPDQRYSFFTARQEGPLVIGETFTDYLRYPDGHPELIGRGSLGSDPRADGELITEEGAHVIFTTVNTSSSQAIQLEPDAPTTGTTAVYDRTIDPLTGAEQTHVVSLLPGDETPTGGQNATYLGASQDGEGIAFELDDTLYLRVGNETTYEIGENVTFAGASAGGERIFYLEGGDLKALDTTGGPPGEVIDFSASGDVTPVNVATGGARAYFVSPSVLGGTNPKGDAAQLGKQNLYLSEEGAIGFVATVTDRDVDGEPMPAPTDLPSDGLGLWTDVLSSQPAKDPSRTNPDGSVLLFQSRAEITGYPAGDFPQIYRYDSGAGRLRCLSCIPTGTPATGGATLQTITFDSLDPPPLSPSAFVPNLDPSGSRVFFESTEALVSTDTDGVQDVYQWEEAGTGSCTRSGGCVHLISSGRSDSDNFLYAHGTSGRDVFFTTSDRLTAEDPSNAVSIYDARVNGGFAAQGGAGECLGEACQPAVQAPAPQTPASSAFRGPGNLGSPTGKRKRRCPKGKRKVRVRKGKAKGKVRCVKRHRVKRKRHRNHRPAAAKSKRGSR